MCENQMLITTVSPTDTYYTNDYYYTPIQVPSTSQYSIIYCPNNLLCSKHNPSCVAKNNPINAGNDLVYIFELPGIQKEQLSVEYDEKTHEIHVKCSKLNDVKDDDILKSYKNEEKSFIINIEDDIKTEINTPLEVTSTLQNGLLLIRVVNVYNKKQIQIN